VGRFRKSAVVSVAHNGTGLTRHIKQLVEVATDGVLLIPEEKKENFKSQKHMERMAHNPMDDLLRQLSDDIKKMANDHLTNEEGSYHHPS